MYSGRRRIYVHVTLRGIERRLRNYRDKFLAPGGEKDSDRASVNHHHGHCEESGSGRRTRPPRVESSRVGSKVGGGHRYLPSGVVQPQHSRKTPHSAVMRVQSSTSAVPFVRVALPERQLTRHSNRPRVSCTRGSRMSTRCTIYARSGTERESGGWTPITDRREYVHSGNWSRGDCQRRETGWPRSCAKPPERARARPKTPDWTPTTERPRGGATRAARLPWRSGPIRPRALHEHTHTRTVRCSSVSRKGPRGVTCATRACDVFAVRVFFFRKTRKILISNMEAEESRFSSTFR